MMEVLIDKVFMGGINAHKLNNLDLWSDILNNNIYGCVLRAEGYVGNRPGNFKGDYHEDDTWAIDCFTEDGFVVDSYLYSSEYEYDKDVKLLKRFE